MKRFLYAVFLSFTMLAIGQEVIPRPVEAELDKGNFQIKTQTLVVVGPELKNEAAYLRVELRRFTGVLHKEIIPGLARRMGAWEAVFLELDPELPEMTHRLEVSPEKVVISGAEAEAVFHGIQSFLQLVPAEAERNELYVPAVTITDRPGSAVREVKLDLARHLYPTGDLKKFIDLLAFHKFNRLSLHLSDDQGWRIESKIFPKLHEVGSMRASTPPYGDRHGSDHMEYAGYYPQERIREIVAHAKSRYIEVIPVLALPGRVSPLLAAYPEWGNGGEVKVANDWSSSGVLLAPKKEVFKALDGLLGEVSTLFGSKLIGIDAETPSLKEWDESAEAQAFLKKQGLKDSEDLKERFLSHLEARAKDLGCEIRCESQISYLRLDQYQRSEALELKNDQKREAVGGLFTARQIYEGEAAPAVLWTQFMPDFQKLNYMAFPRLAAVAEVQWSDALDYEGFCIRLDHLKEHYTKRNIVSGMLFDPPVRKALHGTQVATTLGHHLEHWPEAAFDGKEQIFFLSDRGLEKGDYLTLIFPHAVQGNIVVVTGGEAGEIGAKLADGVLEVSPDGENWDAVAEFSDGLATTVAPAGTHAIRIRVTGAQEEPLIIHEIILAEPLTPEKFIDKREIVVNEQLVLDLTLKADFSSHPEFREKVAALRKRYFGTWQSIATFLGNENTEDRLEIAFGEKRSLKGGVLIFEAEAFGRASLEEVEGLFVSSLARHLQGYHEKTPTWFASGLRVLIREKEFPESEWTRALPKDSRKADALTGGAGSAAFLRWVAKKYGEYSLTALSSRSRVLYEKRRWEVMTGLTFEDLVSEYQK